MIEVCKYERITKMKTTFDDGDFDKNDFLKKLLKLFETFKKTAEDLLKDSTKVEEFLEKFKNFKIPNMEKFIDAFKYIPLMIDLIRAYIKGEYKAVPVKSIIAILAALIYVLSPIDLFPDVIPIIGYIDDATVILLVLKLVKDDLDKDKKWRDENKKKDDEENKEDNDDNKDEDSNKMTFSDEFQKHFKNKTTVNNAFNNPETLPKSHGIYVYRVPEDKISEIEFLDTTTAQETKPNGKTALYPKEELTIKFNNGDKRTLYIGKAESEKDNISESTKQRAEYSHEKNKYIPARGGRAMFQIKDWENIGLEFYYFETEDAAYFENYFLTLYENEYRVLPVANMKK